MKTRVRKKLSAAAENHALCVRRSVIFVCIIVVVRVWIRQWYWYVTELWVVRNDCAGLVEDQNFHLIFVWLDIPAINLGFNVFRIFPEIRTQKLSLWQLGFVQLNFPDFYEQFCQNKNCRTYPNYRCILHRIKTSEKWWKLFLSAFLFITFILDFTLSSPPHLFIQLSITASKSDANKYHTFS